MAALCFGLVALVPQVPAAAVEQRSRPAVRAADLVFIDGRIYTEDDRRPVVEAVVVGGGRILYAGSEAQARSLAGPHTRLIDLHGRTMLPGIADSHIHPALGEFVRRRLCNVRAYTMAEVRARIRECAQAAPPGDWVVVYGLDPTGNPAFGSLDRAQLDGLVPDRRLIVVSLDMHTVWVNSRSLAHLSIDRDTPDPPDGKIDRDPATREPTGALHDAAWSRLYLELLHASPYAASTRELIEKAMPYLNGLGITSILDAYVDDDTEAAYRQLDAEGKLPMRVSLAFVVTAANYRTEIPRIAAKRTHHSPHVRIDYLKLFADGNAEDHLANLLGENGERTAASRGYFTRRELEEIVRLAERHGLSIYVHSIGDGAARDTLDAIAAARAAAPCARCRHTLTHLQWIRPADIVRMKALGIVANVQEGWLSPRAFGGPPGYDYRKEQASVGFGPSLAGRMFPYRAIHEAGVPLAAGSDWYYTEENPWIDIEAGITSREPGVASSVPMLPDSTLDLATLLRARTRGAAYQMYQERDTGSIEAGKRADLVVIDRDIIHGPLEAIHSTRVLLTILDGRPVYGTFDALD